jgi:ATP-dependent Clp protease ATP-binding subunit ClpA
MGTESKDWWDTAIDAALLGLAGYGAIKIIENVLKEENPSGQKIVAGTTSTEELRILDLTPIEDCVVGQNTAIKEIFSTLTLNIKKADKIDKYKSILGSFFLVGPTGVGKTETVKGFAHALEKRGWQFLRFDMNNFTEAHTASTLVGSPKGYVGSNEGGALTKPLMSNPKAVILFDEIEKAHHSLFRVFMTLLDEGEIQEVSTGKRIKLKKSVIFFTSNMFQESIGLLYDAIKDVDKRSCLIKDLISGKREEACEYINQNIVQEEALKFSSLDRERNIIGYPAEFVARIDSIIPFKHLSDKDYKELVMRLCKKCNIKRSDADIDTLVDTNKQYAKTYGVREMLRHIENALFSN